MEVELYATVALTLFRDGDLVLLGMMVRVFVSALCSSTTVGLSCAFSKDECGHH